MTTSTGLGNMFMAGKLRSIMNIRFDSFFNQRKTHYKSQSSHEGSFNNASHSSSSSTSTHPSIQMVPIHIRSKLIALEISDTSVLPEVKDLKIAYRAASMKYHPDRLPFNDPRKKPYELKFHEITAAYEELSELLEKTEKWQILSRLVDSKTSWSLCYRSTSW